MELVNGKKNPDLLAICMESEVQSDINIMSDLSIVLHCRCDMLLIYGSDTGSA